MAFDPDAYLASTEPTPSFDPDKYLAATAPVSQDNGRSGIDIATDYGQQQGAPDLSEQRKMVEEVPAPVKNAAEAAVELVKGVPQMALSTLKGGYEGLKFAVGGPKEQGDVMDEVLSQAIPQGRQLAQDVQSPLGSKESLRRLSIPEGLRLPHQL